MSRVSLDLDLDLDVFSPRGTHGSIKGRNVYTQWVIGAKRVICLMDMLGY